MQNGIYSVKFSSPTTGDLGSGTAIFFDGRVYGGDQSYFYKGSSNVQGETATAQMQVVRHQQGESIFGPLPEFNLELSGNVSGDSFQLQGKMVEQPNMHIRIEGVKVSNL